MRLALSIPAIAIVIWLMIETNRAVVALANIISIIN